MSNWKPADEALADLGLTTKDFKEIFEDGKSEICACGHAKSRHYIDGDVSTCKPSALECQCGKYHPVLKAQDTRLFQYKTTGSGAEHALSKGIRQSAHKKKSVEWLDGALKCAFCGTTENITIHPISGSESNGWRVSVYDVDFDMGRRNGFLCATCVEGM